MRPHQGLGTGRGGAEGGGAGDFQLERFSFSHFGACMLPYMKMQALKPSTRREAWSGGGATCWDGSLSPCWLTFPSSSHSQSVITVISKIHCKSPGITFIILPVTPEPQGPSSLQISGLPGPALGYLSGADQNFLFIPGPGRVVLPWNRPIVARLT